MHRCGIAAMRCEGLRQPTRSDVARTGQHCTDVRRAYRCGTEGLQRRVGRRDPRKGEGGYRQVARKGYLPMGAHLYVRARTMQKICTYSQGGATLQQVRGIMQYRSQRMAAIRLY